MVYAILDFLVSPKSQEGKKPDVFPDVASLSYHMV